MASIPLGSEFPVNTVFTNNQEAPAIATDADGDFIVVWQSAGQDGDSYGIYGQRFDKNGVAQGGEFRINSFTTGVQQSPDVAMDADGNFVVLWEGYDPDSTSGYSIYAKRYNSAGVAQDTNEFVVNTDTTFNHSSGAIAVEADGDFIIVWESGGQDGNGYGIFAQRYTSSGATVGSEFQVNSFTTGVQVLPDVAVADDGSFVVVWQSVGQDTEDAYGIYAQRYDSSGNTVGVEFLVNTTTTDDQLRPSVDMDADGNFVVAWHSYQNGDADIYAQRFDAAGNPIDGEFLVNDASFENQTNVSVSLNAGGDMVITWDDNGQDGSGTGVFGRTYNAQGIAQGGEFQVNTFTTGTQFSPTVALDNEGDFVVAWASDEQDGQFYGIFAQRFEPATTIQFSQALYQVNEDGSVVGASLELVRFGDVSSASVVGVVVADGSAVGGNPLSVGVDYDNTDFPATVTFSAGQSTVTLSVPIVQDTVIESTEDFTVQLVSSSNGAIANLSTATVEILNDDFAPTLAFSQVTVQGSEGAGSIVVTVNRAGVLTNASTGTVSITGGTAQGGAIANAGIDYNNSGFPATISFAPNASTATVSIPIFNDTVLESTETITLNLSNLTNGIAGTQTTTTVQILDDEVAPTVQFSQGIYQVTEDNTGFAVTLVRSGDLTGTATVQVLLDGGSAQGGTSVGSGADYNNSSFPVTVTFAANASTATVTVPIFEDTLIENTETIGLRLTNPTNANTGSQSTSTVQILNDDFAPLVEFSQTTVQVTEDTTTVNFTLTRSGELSNGSQVQVAIAGGTAQGGSSAGSGNDYNNSGFPRSVSFAPGESTKTVSLSVFEDSTTESTETVILQVSSGTNATINSQSTSTLQILDDDLPPTVQFSQSTVQVNEDTTTVNFTVTRSGQLTNGSQVQVSLGGTAQGGTSAGSGNDYNNSGFPRTISFAPGETTKTVAISVFEDSTTESTETVTLQLSSGTNATISTPSVGTLQILDDDAPPTIQFSQVTYRVDEDQSTATLTLNRSGQLTNASTVRVILTGGDATGGSAASGADFNDSAFPITVSFAANQASQTLTIPIFQDTEVENTETIDVSLIALQNGTIGTRGSAQVEIADDDIPATVEFSRSSYEIGEDGDRIGPSVTLTRSGDVSASSVVRVVVMGGSATGGTDYDDSGFPIDITFSAGQVSRQITIPILQDTTEEFTENIDLMVIGIRNVTLGEQDTAALDIIDDDGEEPPVEDTPGILITQTQGSTETKEGDTTDTYRIALDSIPTSSVTVTLTPDDQVDLGSGAGIPIQVTFAADETALQAQTIRVSAVDDGAVEGRHTGTIQHSASSNDPDYNGNSALITVDGADTSLLTVTIRDNDRLPDTGGDDDDDDDDTPNPDPGCKPGINLTGTPGDDRLKGDRNSNILRGRGGDDVLLGKGCDDILKGDAGNDRLLGGDESDSLQGGRGEDELLGGNGKDELIGNGKGDRLDGGDQADILVGGSGADVLTGGSGGDRFVYLSPKDGVDEITDFNLKQDVIDLSAIFDLPRFDSRKPFEDYLVFFGVGRDTVIGLTQPNSGTLNPLIVLDGVAAKDLTIDQFIL
jgi:hypothetical protein